MNAMEGLQTSSSDTCDLDMIPTQDLFFQREVPVSTRFGKAQSEQNLKDKIQKSVPKRTQENNIWVVKVFNEWCVI